MANLFDFKEVETNVSGGSNQKFIYPGIKNHIIIGDVSQGASKSGTPFIEIEMYTKEGGKDSSKKFQFYTSEKAMKMSLEKIKHIATKVVTEEELNAATDIESLKDLLRGKALRMKFSGQEYVNKNGEVKENALIGLAPFAEAIEEGAEHPPVADGDTKLKYDKDNEYDFKKLEVEATESPVVQEGTGKTGW
jgi:hypothetical protein